MTEPAGINRDAVQEMLDETNREIEEIRGRKDTLPSIWIVLTSRAEALRDVLGATRGRPAARDR